MSLLPDTVRQALGRWWGLVSSAAGTGFTTTDTVSAAASIAREAGQPITFTESAAIATLYGYARRIFNAGVVVQAGSDTSLISPDMVATPPWARDIAEQQSYPLYHIVYAFTSADTAGNRTTEFKTSAIPLVLPGTLGELLDSVTSAAQALAAKYNRDLVGVSLHSILAV